MKLDVEDFLEHFGVKGMRWGIRKDRIRSSEYHQKDFSHDKEVFRILAKSGSRPLKDIAFVSTNEIDNQRYIHILNHTISARIFKDSRYENQLILGVNEPLKAPSIKKAELEMVKLHNSNPAVQKFVRDNEIYFGKKPDPEKLTQVVNTALVDNNVLFEGSISLRKEVKNHFQKIGYNSLLDQNDIKAGLARSPLIVFDPEKTLKIVSQSKIDGVIKSASKKTYKETKM